MHILKELKKWYAHFAQNAAHSAKLLYLLYILT